MLIATSSRIIPHVVDEIAYQTRRGTVPPGDRVAVAAAIEAGTVAEDMALRVGRLRLDRQFEPVATGQFLLDIAATLIPALPADPAVIDAVFDEQLRSEQDWQTLVRSLAPRCLGPGQSELSLAGLELLRASPRRRSRIEIDPPCIPDERVSLASIAVRPRNRATGAEFARNVGGRLVGPERHGTGLPHYHLIRNGQRIHVWYGRRVPRGTFFE